MAGWIITKVTRNKSQPSCWRYLLPFLLPSFLPAAAHRGGFTAVEQVAQCEHQEQLMAEAGEG